MNPPVAIAEVARKCPAPDAGARSEVDAAESAWSTLIDALPHSAWVVEVCSRRVVAANAAAAQLFGQTMPALLGLRAEELAVSPEDLAWWDEAASGSAERVFSDTVMMTADGRTLHVSRSLGLLACRPGAQRSHALVTLIDRSTQQRVEVERETLLAELQGTLDATADGILVTDLANRVRAFNERLVELFAIPPDLLKHHDDDAVQLWMSRCVEDETEYQARLRALSQAPLVVTTDPVRLRGGQVLERVSRPWFLKGRPQGRVWSFRDLTERIAAQHQIETLERHDALTGLPNRSVLAERVARAAARMRPGEGFALLVIDLDRFRQINDSLGHASGDRVLLEVAQRIQACLREDDLLVRLGGDEFAVLIQPGDAAAAESAARRVLSAVARPNHLDDAQFTLTCSIGMALSPSHGSSIDELVRHAETAMRAVKTTGRAHHRLHQARAEVDRRSQMRLDHAMRQALVSGRFRLHYQPQVSLVTGNIIGAEALLRWRDPELGEVPPSQFIPVAEDTGFIVALGDWVLQQAVRQVALWHQRGYSLPVAVNVSGLQFQQLQFVDRVRSVLASSNVPPSLIELELTESFLVRDADETLQRLQALDRLGVRLSIDDFGTGYSSLAYLKRFPVGKLKIDRSFVSGLPDDQTDAGIVRAIVQMAGALSMKVIAEGVETEPQREFLRSAGCEEFQGFLFAPALDSVSFEDRLAASTVADPQGSRHIRLVSG